MNIKLEKLLPGVKKNILLKNYTTFKIGGKAKYFFVAKDKKDLVSVIKVVKKNRLPFFILGGGSNLLVSDKGFKGLVIRIPNSEFQIQNSKIIAKAGTSLWQLVSTAAKFGLAGLEWAAGIPGTIGGAIFGNAGAFGKSMKDVVKKVEIFDTKDLRFKIFDFKKCKFDYRESIFKKKKNLIIISTELQLKKGNKKEIQSKIKKHLDYKRRTQPLNYPSAGSVFKNPSQSTLPTKKFSAGLLIEKCKLKGLTLGGAKISEKHANFIINLGKARAKDVKKLINLIKKAVKKKFKVILEEEIIYLGF